MSGNKKWEKLKSTELFKGSFFRVRSDEVKLASGKIMPSYYVFEYVDWVHVVALTPENEVVLIRQYRHAAEEEIIEIPGGSLDPRRHETPEEAAGRELLEETGFSFEKIHLAGCLYPNPAAQNNRLWTYVATNCVQVQEQNLDPYEEIEVFILPFEEMQHWVDQGKVTHGLMLASLRLAEPVFKKLGIY